MSSGVSSIVNEMNRLSWIKHFMKKVIKNCWENVSRKKKKRSKKRWLVKISNHSWYIGTPYTNKEEKDFSTWLVYNN